MLRKRYSLYLPHNFNDFHSFWLPNSPWKQGFLNFTHQVAYLISPKTVQTYMELKKSCFHVFFTSCTFCQSLANWFTSSLLAAANQFSDLFVCGTGSYHASDQFVFGNLSHVGHLLHLLPSIPPFASFKHFLCTYMPVHTSKVWYDFSLNGFALGLGL